MAPSSSSSFFSHLIKILPRLTDVVRRKLFFEKGHTCENLVLHLGFPHRVYALINFNKETFLVNTFRVIYFVVWEIPVPLFLFFPHSTPSSSQEIPEGRSLPSLGQWTEGEKIEKLRTLLFTLCWILFSQIIQKCCSSTASKSALFCVEFGESLALPKKVTNLVPGALDPRAILLNGP